MTVLMTILQSTLGQSTVEGSFLQYGVVGALALILGYFAWTQYNRLVTKNDNLEKKIDALQEEMMSLIVEQKDQLVDLVKANTEALRDLQKLVLEYVIRGK
tara:strand:- start:606 stop:908 length:303 start_codon:yes stop_codon:yes gene_type:complete